MGLEMLTVWNHFKEVMVASLVSLVTCNSTQQCGGKWPAPKPTTQLFRQVNVGYIKGKDLKKNLKVYCILLESHLEIPIRGPKQNVCQ